MMALLNWRLWAAGALTVLLAGTHWRAYTQGKKTVMDEWNAEKQSIAEQSFKLAEQATRVTVGLQANADTLRKTKNAEIDKLGADLARALDGLRDRPARPGAGRVPIDAGAGPATGCTGAGLYDQDAEFSLREAARANKMKANLAQCQDLYNAARDKLN